MNSNDGFFFQTLFSGSNHCRLLMCIVSWERQLKAREENAKSKIQEVHVQNTYVVNIFVIVDAHLLRNAAVCADGLLQVRI